MKLNIKTQIVREDTDFLKNKHLTESIFEASSDALAAEFKVDSVITDNYLIDQTEAGTFSLDLFNTIKIDKSKAIFIHIFAYEITGDENKLPDPIEFQLTLGGVIIGKFSQFQLLNISNYTSDIVIDQFNVGLDKVANLVIVVGSKF